MRPRRLTAELNTAELFARAVRERALAVLTIQQGGDWLTYKSRFLERDAARRFFVLDYLPDGDAPLPPLAPGQCVGVSLRQSSRKYMFASAVEARGQFVIDRDNAIPAIRYRWPDSITELQRRVYYRTPVPPGLELPVRLWAGGIQARPTDADDERALVEGTLMNLSCGGAQVGLDTPLDRPWGADELVGCEITLPDGRGVLELDAHYRGPRPDSDFGRSLAVQFVGLELGEGGRQKLARLAQCVNRLYRLGGSQRASGR